MIFVGRFLGSERNTSPGSAAGELCKKSIDAVKGDLPMAPWRFLEIRRWLTTERKDVKKNS